MSAEFEINDKSKQTVSNQNTKSRWNLPAAFTKNHTIKME